MRAERQMLAQLTGLVFFHITLSPFIEFALQQDCCGKSGTM
jgi:hypothetical protein